MIGILEHVFGCSHKKTTFPISRTTKSATVTGAARLAYVVCLDCGREFDYDWQAMKIVRPAPESAAAALPPKPGVSLHSPAHVKPLEAVAREHYIAHS